PSFSRILDELDNCQRRIRALASDVGIETSGGADQSDASEEATAPSKSSTSSSTPGADRLETREDAFRLLGKLATFFETSEPLSPIGPALRQLIRWRTMTFADLMRHLIEDPSVRRELFRRTGVEEEKNE
ncbi:MAG: hypothetical protein KF861_19740, partial [Planctomycetaceae bacterium]|nr:hypothetical protein [Planctomycetaceae bacterium]